MSLQLPSSCRIMSQVQLRLLYRTGELCINSKVRNEVDRKRIALPCTAMRVRFQD